MPITKTEIKLNPIIILNGKFARFTGNEVKGNAFHKLSGLHYQYSVLNQGKWKSKYLTPYQHGQIQEGQKKVDSDSN